MEDGVVPFDGKSWTKDPLISQALSSQIPALESRPEEAQETIFEEFKQVKGSDPQHKGTGLGLPITKGFAELLGGSISVQSMEGKGSTFTVRVPVEYKAD